MSTFELDETLVRKMLPQLRDLLGGEEAEEMANRLDEQLPQDEPDREFLIKDALGNIWAWDERQLAWGNGARYLLWPTLVAQMSPLRLYGEIQ